MSLLSLLHSLADFSSRCALGSSRSSGLGFPNTIFRVILVQILDFVLGHETFVLEPDFAAALVAVPEDEQED